MGQSSSRGVSAPAERRRSSQHSPTPRRISHVADGSSTPESQPTSRSSAHNFLSFTRLRSGRPDAGSSQAPEAVLRRRSRLSRAQSSISSILSRPRSSSRSRDRPARTNTRRLSAPFAPFWSPAQPSSSTSDSPGSPLPRLQMPELAGALNIDDLAPESPETDSLLQSPLQSREQDVEPERPTSLQHSNSILDRVAGSVVPERSSRNVRNSLRRRRSPLNQNEDNAAMLSRLLSVAAAATAATLMGEDHRAGAEARNFVGGDEDGTFDGFLQSLQNGRIASALRGHTAGMDVDPDESGPPAPLNFFRMFRFGSSTATRRETTAPMSQGSQDDSDEASGAQRADEDGSESQEAPGWSLLPKNRGLFTS
ncbi:Zinc finger RING-type protein [Lasiodiplodia theobromae]|uniref:Zinc finger RING-type protein n=1 Tax=Lasiodiplodia theobromae TaxID=45133 RepID=UPI0015C3AD83|nr:Zinc finger RING-type protein [Lasiodiplodia theobromae]KAF4541188.1 Zinc finger RING-type protein [Lasiodiplodia theobromae]